MKDYCFRVEENVFSECGAIRNQIDIIHRVLMVTRYLNAYSGNEIFCNPQEANLIICVDKMSRIFFGEVDKIHSMHFPFRIVEKRSGLEFHHRDRVIDQMTIEVIEAQMHQFEKISTSFESMFDSFCETMDDFSVVSEIDKQFYWGLFLFMLTMEPGYLRYDHDGLVIEEHLDIHPIDHIDFFFSGANTFKVGLESRISWKELQKVVDIKERCYFLH